MKSVFITFDQAFFERIMALLDRHNCRGFSYWQQVQGRGSKTGEPHYGSHAWPSMCSAIITIIDEAKVAPLLEALHRMDRRPSNSDSVLLFGISNRPFNRVCSVYNRYPRRKNLVSLGIILFCPERFFQPISISLRPH